MVYLSFPRASLWLSIFIFLLPQSRGNAIPETAKKALAVLKIQRGALADTNVTHVRGHRGQDQPITWEFTVRISDGERVFVIQNEEIIADTIYSSGGGIIMDLRRFKTDSSEVFKVANLAAEEANIGFDSLDYELLAAPLGNAPLWIVFLRDFKGHDVGRLEVSGEVSKVLRSQWFAPRASRRQPIGPDDDDRKTVLRSYTPKPSTGERNPGSGAPVKTLALETGKRLKRGFLTVGNGLNRIFNKQETVSTDPPRFKSPATTSKKPR